MEIQTRFRAKATQATPTPASAEIVTVRPTEEVMTRQRLSNFIGISEATAGSTGIAMNLVIIPPGGAAEPHLHQGYETAIYVLSGWVRTRYGPNLAQESVNNAINL